ncbi:MAG: lipid-A-disaccharide synthase [Rhodobacteraceae bacterium]|nr:lipid-A-disaccharide synthase [Paracoccaceae bacterium]
MKIYLVAGEASGDALGASLMRGLRHFRPEIAFSGVGGPLMAAEGLASLFPMDELSVMGLAEILPRYRSLRRRLTQTVEDVLAQAPDALVTIDSPDFTLRVAAGVRARAQALRTIHYVAPSVWAWRPGRAGRMARSIDHVLALLPFEPPYMRAAGMTCDFVGHPVVSEPRAGAVEAAAFRETHMIGPEQPLALCLPGSRRGEVTRLMPIFAEALMQLRDREPGLRVVVPTTPAMAPLVRMMAARWAEAPLVVEAAADKRAAFAAADVALAASGTVSLELAANAVPMVIGYDMHPLTRMVMKRLVRVETVTLVNLVSGTRAVPEFLGRDCRPDRMARVLAALLEDDAARADQIAAMDLCMDRLGRGGEAPGLRAARSVLAVLGNGRAERNAAS